MIGFCLKCSKDLADKRRGTVYCSESCRAASWQKVKRVAAKQAEPVQVDTEQLLKLTARGASLIQQFEVFKQMDDVVAGDEIPDLAKVKAELVEWCRLMTGHPNLRPRKNK